MVTPHLEAKKGAIAPIVLMPGDPLRAKYIAENYLERVTQFNQIRNMNGYTGYYEGQRVSVLGSGMGMPSLGIYVYELYKFYGVEKIIRIGSCGALTKSLNLYDLVLVEHAYSDSTYAYVHSGNEQKLFSAASDLIKQIAKTAFDEGINVQLGNIYTSDIFYRELPLPKAITKYHCLAVEMETFALFYLAHHFNQEAAAVLTVSDSLVTNEEIKASERERNFDLMIKLVLKSIK